MVRSCPRGGLINDYDQSRGVQRREESAAGGLNVNNPVRKSGHLEVEETQRKVNDAIDEALKTME